MINTCTWILDNDEPCGELCEGRTIYCASHNRQNRKEKASMIKAIENSKLFKRKGIKKVSEKRKELNKEYFILVEQFKKDNPHCKAKVNEYCTKATEDIHHRKGRNTFLLDVSTFLPVCRSCHNYIEAHPKEAKERGWSDSRLATQEPHKI